MVKYYWERSQFSSEREYKKTAVHMQSAYQITLVEVKQN